MRRKSIIFGIKGTIISSREKLFLRRNKPWGIILFSRNIQNVKQLKHLIDNIKDCSKDRNYPILIDQEGGQISRLNKNNVCRNMLSSISFSLEFSIFALRILCDNELIFNESVFR